MLGRMEWFSTPPWTQLELADYSDAEKGLVELTGPSTLARVAGGVTVAMGAGFVATALRFARLPLPLPFKLVPLVIGAVGAGAGALGASVVTAEHSILAQRFSGLTFRWRLGPLPARTLRVKVEEIDAFELTRHLAVSSEDDSAPTVSHRLVVVTKDGRALPIEEFGTRAQARQRKELLELALGPPPPRRAEVLKKRKRRKVRAEPVPRLALKGAGEEGPTKKR
jgi:hypothetical protein